MFICNLVIVYTLYIGKWKMGCKNTLRSLFNIKLLIYSKFLFIK